ncbi:MAG: hypothetical protein ACE5KX_00135 [Acidimicrobiia bacterium]
MIARPLPVALPGPRFEVIHGAGRAASRLRPWLVFCVMVVVAFFLLIYSRVALDRSAFVLAELERQMTVDEARYWELRLETAELQAPDRIRSLAEAMGLVYPEEVRTVVVPGLGEGGSEADDRWVDLKPLLSAQP